jgi:hypothetical protein
LEESVNELSAAQSGKAAKESICEDWTATWERNKEVRQTELSLIANVANILATKLDTAKDFIVNRIESKGAAVQAAEAEGDFDFGSSGSSDSDDSSSSSSSDDEGHSSGSSSSSDSSDDSSSSSSSSSSDSESD